MRITGHISYVLSLLDLHKDSQLLPRK